MLIFPKVVRKKPAIILRYKPFGDVLQRLKLDNKNTFFPEQIFVTVLVYSTVSKRWLKSSFVSRPSRRRSTC